MEQTSEATGETEVAAVVVSRTLPHSVKTVWDVLMTSDGSEALLGPGGLLGSKGTSWQSHDGRQGVIRSFHPLEQIRFSWRLRDSAQPSLVDVRLIPAGDDATEVQIAHSKLAPGADRAWVKDRWEAALDRIESDCL
ncbi:MAG: SRPBCC family protein [Brooklawnia sp.]|jgi:uncharacterized protein YndB with AHSA1/START domain